MIPKIKRFIGTGFYWQSIIEDEDGVIWEGWFNSFTKRTKWRKQPLK